MAVFRQKFITPPPGGVIFIFGFAESVKNGVVYGEFGTNNDPKVVGAVFESKYNELKESGELAKMSNEELLRTFISFKQRGVPFSPELQSEYEKTLENYNNEIGNGDAGNRSNAVYYPDDKPEFLPTMGRVTDVIKGIISDKAANEVMGIFVDKDSFFLQENKDKIKEVFENNVNWSKSHVFSNSGKLLNLLDWNAECHELSFVSTDKNGIERFTEDSYKAVFWDSNEAYKGTNSLAGQAVQSIFTFLGMGSAPAGLSQGANLGADELALIKMKNTVEGIVTDKDSPILIVKTARFDLEKWTQEQKLEHGNFTDYKDYFKKKEQYDWRKGLKEGVDYEYRSWK
jgi:hypothetical protein